MNDEDNVGGSGKGNNNGDLVQRQQRSERRTR
jgi:hypothetical protein